MLGLCREKGVIKLKDIFSPRSENLTLTLEPPTCTSHCLVEDVIDNQADELEIRFGFHFRYLQKEVMRESFSSFESSKFVSVSIELSRRSDLRVGIVDVVALRRIEKYFVNID